jgi:hypothetical protein
MSFPATTQSALQMVNAIRAGQDPHGRSSQGLAAPVFAEMRA